MKMTLKPIEEQVVVITGASSGIGLATARLAAKRGAKLVLAARSGDALELLVGEITSAGGTAVAVEADVSAEEDVRRISERALEAFDGYDTWVNNAGVSIYGELTKVPVSDMRTLFETNFWSVVYGSLTASAHLRERGGALINLGSSASDRAIPLQGMYSASKHAIKGFTDALRMELEHEGVPVSVTLVKPGPIDTPFLHHAKNYLEREPTHVPPVYAAEAVAKAIVHCAGKPMRDVFVGSGGKSLSALGELAPRLADKLLPPVFFSKTESEDPSRPLDQNNLGQPMGELEESGGYEGIVRPVSVYTEATMHPGRAAAVAGVGAAAVALRRITKTGG